MRYVFKKVSNEFCGQSVNDPNAGRRYGFLFLFRLRTVRNSKFSALQAVAADGPVPDALTLWHALGSGTGRHLLGLQVFA